MKRFLAISFSLLLTEGFAFLVFYAGIIISVLISNLFIKTPRNDLGTGLFFVFLWMSIGLISVLTLVPLFYSACSSFLLNKFARIKVQFLKNTSISYVLFVPAIIAAVVQGQIWDKMIPGKENIIYTLTFITYNLIAIPLVLYFTKRAELTNQTTRP